MIPREKPFILLLAEDDEEDWILVRDALGRSSLSKDLHRVTDGVELLDYLRHHGAHADPAYAPKPDLILLDLNMPKKDGRTVLAEIKADPRLRLIPIVVLTTSRAEEDIALSYELGANSFIVKPKAFLALVDTMKNLMRYWVETVVLPPQPEERYRWR